MFDCNRVTSVVRFPLHRLSFLSRLAASKEKTLALMSKNSSSHVSIIAMAHKSVRCVSQPAAVPVASNREGRCSVSGVVESAAQPSLAHLGLRSVVHLSSPLHPCCVRLVNAPPSARHRVGCADTPVSPRHVQIDSCAQDELEERSAAGAANPAALPLDPEAVSMIRCGRFARSPSCPLNVQPSPCRLLILGWSLFTAAAPSTGAKEKQHADWRTRGWKSTRDRVEGRDDMEHTTRKKRHAAKSLLNSEASETHCDDSEPQGTAGGRAVRFDSASRSQVSDTSSRSLERSVTRGECRLDRWEDSRGTAVRTVRLATECLRRPPGIDWTSHSTRESEGKEKRSADREHKNEPCAAVGEARRKKGGGTEGRRIAKDEWRARGDHGASRSHRISRPAKTRPRKTAVGWKRAEAARHGRGTASGGERTCENGEKSISNHPRHARATVDNATASVSP